ncbi:unnamed protein product [Allacma fusca]|uniref:Uncharacterized protein n=1 Tax=Allacma fusca TaxID=39272 RepID=A0A8J2LA86_9HEXA|nr:unnamed protein product [Allacma fusca]
MKRFQFLERKLSNNHDLNEQYSKCMQEYIDLGHMKLVPEDELNLPDSETYYLPHHAVLKESSTSTNLRVVFDASAKTSSGYSLNDKMLIGPVVQNDLYSILFPTVDFCLSWGYRENVPSYSA